MDRSKLFTTGLTIVAATASVGLMIYNESQYQEAVATEPMAVASVQPNALPEPIFAVATPEAPAGPVADAMAEVTPAVLSAPVLPDLAVDRTMLPPGRTPRGDDLRLPTMPQDRATALAPLPTDTGLARRIARLGLNDVVSSDAVAGVQRNSFGVPCGVTASGSARPAGLVDLTVTAPCRPNATITVRHGEMVFTDTTNALGTYRADVPALASPAEISVEFRDGATAMTAVEVPDLARLSRVVLQEMGTDSLQIHALEFGAAYGEAGHVWSGAPRAADFTETGQGGFVMRVGSASGLAPRSAEVYTFPEGAAQQDGVVRLSIEAEVTPMNCGREVEAATIQPEGTAPADAVSLTLSMPGCEAVGEFLVLKNVLRDLRIAAR